MSPAPAWELLRWRSRVPVHRQELAEGVEISLARIPAGSFVREGSDQRLTLAEFLLGQTPITQAQWRAVAGWEPPEGEEWALQLKPDPSRFKGDDRPVEQVSWYEAMEFCQRLRHRTGKAYTLPSEAQWEYACRAGTTTPFHFGDTISPELANYYAGWAYSDGPTGELRRQSTDVDLFPANAWGLQDMHGNVSEWCLDEWHSDYNGAPGDGSAWLDHGESGDGDSGTKNRLLRGGSWVSFPNRCRSTDRFNDHPDSRADTIGFRVCCLPQDSASLPLNA